MEKEERQREEMERQMNELKEEKDELREQIKGSWTYSNKGRARFRILGAHPAGQIVMWIVS